MASMENQMQDRFDAWDSRMAAAQADAKAYVHNLAAGNDRCCLAIEEAWGLAGYPPQVVSTFLAEVAGGASDEAAEATALSSPAVAVSEIPGTTKS